MPAYALVHFLSLMPANQLQNRNKMSENERYMENGSVRESDVKWRSFCTATGLTHVCDD